MLRHVAGLLFALGLVTAGSGPARAQGVAVNTDVPPSIEACVTDSLRELWNIYSDDEQGLFEYFLANIDIEQFGRYNYKRAWVEWGDNADIKRLALYEYVKLMMGERGDHEGVAEAFDARLAERPLVKGDNVYHIILTVDFSDGSSTTIVVFTAGCRAFGFVYGGANLRSFVDPNVVERLYRAGRRSPY